MVLERLAYVSCSTRPAEALIGVSDIVEQSVRNNRANNITGALAFTSSRFAQVLEGSHGSLDVLVLKLAMDTRHCDMVIVDRVPIQHRRFADWAMIAPRFTPHGQVRLVAIIDDRTPSMTDLTELLFELVGEQKAESGPHV
ncbi:BLUF domain-containing protein [Brevundimonas sp.]|uniref:BLUF domain-containing protein n=1 Tax=Brevundimonas sp. TaxID=1871086 RepID=UPI0035622124